jgi:actin-like ATPase involved in cell morphogenesis
MSYRVGIDFGTTFTAAAVHRDGEQSAELVTLGESGVSAASVVFVAPDGSYVMGDAAVRRAVTDPDRVVREVKRRIGDATPLLVDGEPIGAHSLAARFIGWVADRVAEREGEPPEAIAVTCPASWGPHKRMLLTDALGFQGLSDVTLVTEPEAAAVAYATSQHVTPGSAIGVYDLGGGTFDTAIVRQLDDGGFALTGRPDGVDPLGGIDFDDAVFEHVRESLGSVWTGLDFTDPQVRSAAATLRRECTDAKKALSSDTEVTIPVLLPGVSTQVRMVRAEFEALIAPAVEQTVEAMRRTIDSADLGATELSAVLLVGGSSRIPLVAQRVSAELDLPVTVDSDPKAVVALGAALSIAPVAAVPDTAAPGIAAADRPARSRHLFVLGGVGLAACVTLAVLVAGPVGTDVREGGGVPAAAADVGPSVAPGASTPVGTVDPWTGEPYTETTKPGPTRRNAEPTKASPAKLSPAPTTTQNRAALIDGTPPISVVNGPSGTSGPDPRASDPTVTDPPPSESSASEPTVSEPPPVDPPSDTPPVDTTTDTPPPVDPTIEEPPPSDTPVETVADEPPPPAEENP